jgi:chemotaxis protein CheC
MNEQSTIWQLLTTDPAADSLLQEVFTHVAAGISTMAQRRFQNSTTKIRHVTFSEIPNLLGTLEQESVGVYLRIEHGLSGQALLIMPTPFALNLAEMVTKAPPGMISELGEMERSALAEVGNLTLSYFLNAVAMHTNSSDILWPSPPMVMVDMLGAILDVIIASAASTTDDVIILEAVLEDLTKSVWARLWILPDMSAIDSAEDV